MTESAPQKEPGRDDPARARETTEPAPQKEPGRDESAPEKKPGRGDISRMTFLDHLMELRARIIISLITIFATATLALVFYRPIFDALRRPHDRIEIEVTETGPDGQPVRGADGQVVKKMVRPLLRTRAPQDGILIIIKLGLLAGLLLASPMIIYEIWCFVSPGLFLHERRAILPIFYSGLLFFLGGAALAYFFVLERALQYCYIINASLGVKVESLLHDYLSLVVAIVVGFGLVFETPLILIAVTKLGLVRVETLARHRKHVIVLAFVIGALLTPPDIISQLVMAPAIIILFEGSLIFIRLTSRSRKPAPVASAEERQEGEKKPAAGEPPKPAEEPAPPEGKTKAGENDDGDDGEDPFAVYDSPDEED